LAYTYQYLGRYSDALEYYDEAIGVDPGMLQALVKAAWIHYTTGNYAAAVPYLERALRLNPRYVVRCTGPSMRLLDCVID